VGNISYYPRTTKKTCRTNTYHCEAAPTKFTCSFARFPLREVMRGLVESCLVTGHETCLGSPTEIGYVPLRQRLWALGIVLTDSAFFIIFAFSFTRPKRAGTGNRSKHSERSASRCLPRCMSRSTVARRVVISANNLRVCCIGPARVLRGVLNALLHDVSDPRLSELRLRAAPEGQEDQLTSCFVL